MNRGALERALWNAPNMEPRILAWLTDHVQLDGPATLRLNETIVNIANMNSLVDLRELAVEAVIAYTHVTALLRQTALTAHALSLRVLAAPLHGDLPGPADPAPQG